MSSVQGRTVGLLVGLGLAMPGCKPADEPAGSTGTETSGSSGPAGTSSSGADSSSSTAETSSTGESIVPLPDPCETAEIAQGIVGRTDERSCDTEGDCVAPESGVAVWLFEQNPQIGGDASDPGMLDPAVPMLESTTSDGQGLFGFALGASSYYVCTPEPSDRVLCSERIIIVGADPLYAARYEHGNGSSWSTRACVSP